MKAERNKIAEIVEWLRSPGFKVRKLQSANGLEWIHALLLEVWPGVPFWRAT